MNLPFTDPLQNYRANVVHITQFIILMVTNYYRSMKSTTPLEIKSRMHTAATIEIVAIVICVVISFVVLVYELVQFFRKICKDNQKKKILNDSNMTQEDIIN